jgi:hypothetical protein
VWGFDGHDRANIHGCNQYQCEHGHESERNDHCRLDTCARLGVFDICDNCNSVTVTVVVDDYSTVTDYDEDTLTSCDLDPNGDSNTDGNGDRDLDSNPVACGGFIDTNTNTDGDIVEH